MGFSPAPVPESPPSGGTRIMNFFVENGRGVVGSIPIVVLTIMLLAAQDDLKHRPEKVVLFVYLIMFSCLLFHPIKVPGAAFVPVFAFPLLHVQDSNTICRTYFCSNTCLLIVGGYLHQVINASDWHKRFAVWLIYGKDANKISTVGILAKSSVAAYVLSLISSRQHTTKFIMALVIGSMKNSDKKEKDNSAEPDASEAAMCGILANAISSSSAIGSMGIVIGARNVMVMRSLWEMSIHPDTFNFLDYFCFAFPLSLMMFLLNLIYNIVVAKIAVKDEMSASKLIEYRKAVMKFMDDIQPKLSSHEILSLFFTFLSLMLYSTRWSNVMFKITGKTRGWADSKNTLDKMGNTKIPDVTIAAIMLVICCILPTSFNFLKVMSAKTESELPPARPDSAIVFWKFVDKNTNYGYMFLVGGFGALDSGMKRTLFPSKYLYKQLSFITKKELPVSILLWCVIAGALCNVMTSFAAAGMLTLVALNCYSPDNVLLAKHYQFILATGVGSGFGFFTHFKYTPMYTVKTIAKVATTTQLKYNFGSILICTLILWAGIYLYAPLIFE